MPRFGLAAALLAASIALAACEPPPNEGLRIIVSSGPVYDVPARDDAPKVKPVPQAAGRGTLILEGGGESLDEASQMTVALAGTKPLICLIESAPHGAGDAYHKFDGISGFRMVAINLAGNSGKQPRVLETLEGCTGYFFNDGDPAMLSGALRPNADETPALKLIRQRYEREGVVIAGTGAGSMIAGDLTLCACGAESSVDALSRGRIYEAGDGLSLLEFLFTASI